MRCARRPNVARGWSRSHGRCRTTTVRRRPIAFPIELPHRGTRGKDIDPGQRVIALFLQQFLAELQESGVRLGEITLHVGLGTFAPVKTDRVEDHTMHEEWYSISETTAAVRR